MAYETTVTYLGAVQFEAECRGHKVICDQPEANKGFDEGMTPPEFLLVSLGTCAAYYAAEYLNKHALPASDLKVNVKAEKVKPPARLDQFEISIVAPNVDLAAHREGLLASVQKCLIHNTLHHPPSIQVTAANG
jgi:putative redox protein